MSNPSANRQISTRAHATRIIFIDQKRKKRTNERTSEREWIFCRSLELTFLDFQIWSRPRPKLLTETNYSFLLLLPLKATSNRTATAASSSSFHSCWIFPFNGRSNGSESNRIGLLLVVRSLVRSRVCVCWRAAAGACGDKDGIIEHVMKDDD